MKGDWKMLLADELTLKETVMNLYTKGKKENQKINDIVSDITKRFNIRQLSVDERVTLSKVILETLSEQDRMELAKKLLKEQVVEQREKLSIWSTLTSQTAQIDTGYIAQHLVSLVTQIPGQGMRGKGDDLIDGSEVKSANFLDSLDKRGAVAPRWNFTAVNVAGMEAFLEYDKLFLVSMDLNTNEKFRVRIWKVNVKEHNVLKQRYIEWMNKLGYPKFQNTTGRPSVNFQLFPPRNKTNENFARHGNGREDGFQKLKVELENTQGSELIFHAEEDMNGEIQIYKFN